ncbi:MAG TPA: sulfotransferase [Burkholderiaceae bacterium]|nr:sulfotransferase [Burkholderiaceae bacterium]
MLGALKALEIARHGPAQARAMHRHAIRRGTSIVEAVRVLEKLCPGDAATDTEEPIFLLSAGWRSGSTMLQRLVMSDPRVLIWGEPYDECGLVQAMAAAMRPFREGWPPADYFYDGRPTTDLTGEWIANLFPSLADWRRGQRAMFDTMYAEPARRAGSTRWGIKEVRLTAEHCFYLRWLYPRARFVLLLRHPLDAYRSYVRYGRSWYDTFPDRPVFTPVAFGSHWGKLATGFRREADALGALVMKYEDLAAGRFDPALLESHLGLTLDRKVLARKVGSSERGGEMAAVNALERWLLKRAVGPAAADFGYGW